MNNQQINAIATVDAHLKNAGLPTYSELSEFVSELADGLCGGDPLDLLQRARQALGRCTEGEAL